MHSMLYGKDYMVKTLTMSQTLTMSIPSSLMKKEATVLMESKVEHVMVQIKDGFGVKRPKIISARNYQMHSETFSIRLAKRIQLLCNHRIQNIISLRGLVNIIVQYNLYYPLYYIKDQNLQSLHKSWGYSVM